MEGPQPPVPVLAASSMLGIKGEKRLQGVFAAKEIGVKLPVLAAGSMLGMRGGERLWVVF